MAQALQDNAEKESTFTQAPEQSVASTKAFTNMVGALALFALQLGRSRHLSKTKGKSITREMRMLPDKIRSYLENPGSIDEAVELVTKGEERPVFGKRNFIASGI